MQFSEEKCKLDVITAFHPGVNNIGDLSGFYADRMVVY